MILLPVWTLIVTCFATKAFSEVIHCYECDDCKNTKKILLQACPQPVTALIDPDTTLPAPTTISPPLEGTKPPESATTVAIEEPVTALATHTEPAPASEPEAEPEPAKEENDDENSEKLRKRSVRNVNYKSVMNHRRFVREIEANSYYCYTIKDYGEDQKKVKKGCVKVTGDKSACDVLKEEYNVPAERCAVCKKNKCNNSATRGVCGYLHVGIAFLVLLVLQNV